MNWTDEQEKAITTRGGRILVAAAAGSGKTAVLSERILDYIKKGGDLDKLLVVTFTNLAAVEMKERIRKKLKKEGFEDQVLKIDNAKIMTMDAFYNKLIKENAILFGINPNFKLIDQPYENILKKEAAKEVLETRCDSLFVSNFYDVKKISIGEEELITLYNFFKKIPFKHKYQEEMIKEFSKTNFGDTIWGQYLFNEIREVVNSYRQAYMIKLDLIERDSELCDKLHPFIFEELSEINSIINSIEHKDYELLRESITMEFKRYPSIKDTKDNFTSNSMKLIRADLKKVLGSYKSIMNLNNDEIIEANTRQKEILLDTFAFLEEMDKLIKTKKEEYMSFEDIQSLVIDKLVEDYDYETDKLIKSSFALDLEREFDEILIDEYQDTNLLQDLIFRALSKDNLFVVGDVKQSIYGFRGSNPNIMINVKENSSLNSFPMLLLLSKNFRSRKEILDFTNYIFESIMSKQFGSIEYNDIEKLYLGRDFPENSDVKVEVNIIKKEKEEEIEGDKVEVEAAFIASKIKKLIDEGENPKDFAILLRGTKNKATVYREALLKEGVSVYTEVSKRYFDNYEIKFMTSILRAIISNDKLSLVAILRSPLFGFDEQTIFENIENPEQLIKDKLETYRLKAKELPIDKLINYLYVDLDIIKVMTNFANGEERLKNLLDLVKHAKNFKGRSNNLNDFINYIDQLIKNDSSLDGTNPAPNKDSVLITSIHKSKGLQFKHVFLPDLSKKFNFMDVNDNLLLETDYYVGFDLRNNYDRFTNINSSVIKMVKKKAIVEEEMRILYVALTRAEEYLYLSAYTSGIENKIDKVLALNDLDINNFYLKTCASYFDLMLPVLLKSKNAENLVTLSNSYTKYIADTPNFELNIFEESSIEILNDIKQSNSINNKVLDNLNKNIVFNNETSKSIISVTEIKGKPEKVPAFLRGNDPFKAGNVYHNLLEDIPFKAYSYLEFKENVLSIVKDDIEHIDIDKIYKFFEDDFYKEIILNSTISKEQEISFIYKDSLVDGIIDLLCIKGNDYYLIDYKSDKIGEDEIIKRYKVQLDLYEEALNTKENINVYKYIYSIYNEKFIRIN